MNIPFSWRQANATNLLPKPTNLVIEMKDLICTSMMPKEVQKRLECNLLHERKPILTGRKINDPITKEMDWEIIWKCEICENQRDYSVTLCLPDNGQRVLAFGYRTFCCDCDKEDERQWHEVVFSFKVSAYKIKKQIPENLEETILEKCECYEHWDFDDEEPFDHLIGVTKWKKLISIK